MSLLSNIQGCKCSVASCGDFVDLPFFCPKCKVPTCEKHRLFQDHDCKSFFDCQIPTCPICSQLIPVPAGEDPNKRVSTHIERGCPKESLTVSSVPMRLNFCAFKDCTANEHVNIRCKGCNNQHCVAHRLPEDHNCVRFREQEARKARLLAAEKVQKTAKLQQDIASLSMLSTQKFSNTPQKPVGQSSVEVADRMQFPVFFPVNSKIQPCHMFFHKSWPIGKVIDRICSHGGLRNDNNRVGPEGQYFLFRLKDGFAMPANVSFESLKPDLSNGDYLMLSKGPILPQIVTDEIMALSLSSSSSSGSSSGFSHNIPKQRCSSSAKDNLPFQNPSNLLTTGRNNNNNSGDCCIS